jgi:hypothetical protein
VATLYNAEHSCCSSCWELTSPQLCCEKIYSIVSNTDVQTAGRCYKETPCGVLWYPVESNIDLTFCFFSNTSNLDLTYFFPLKILLIWEKKPAHWNGNDLTVDVAPGYCICGTSFIFWAAFANILVHWSFHKQFVITGLWQPKSFSFTLQSRWCCAKLPKKTHLLSLVTSC